MSVAGLVLGVVATVLAVVSLGWQAVTHSRQRPRPKLTPVIGRLTPEGLVTNEAGADVGKSLAEAAEQTEDIVIGVKVVNAGRVPFNVAGWAVRSEPDGTSLVRVEKPTAGADVPHDIAPGGHAVFLTELHHVGRFATATAAHGDQQQRIVLTVSSGKRTYATEPVAPEVFSAD